jgi:uncharacterized protein involved in outer membrane biogenesis
MRKWFIALAALLVLCATVVVALLNLNALAKQNRDFLLAQAERALGRKITAGDIELTIMRGIGLEVKDFALADDPAFSSGAFVRAKELQINVKFWPLLKKQFEIKNVILRESVITISRNRVGDFNFSSIARRDHPSEATEDQTKQPGEKRDGPPGGAVYLANIADGEVIYRDEKDGVNLDLKRVELTIKQASGGKPVTVEVQASLFSEQRNLKVEGRLGPIVRGADISRLRLNGSIEIDSLDVQALQTKVPNVKSLLPKELRLSGTLGASRAKFNGTLENLAVSGTLEGSRAAITLGKNFSKASGIPLELNANAQYANETIYIRNADLKLHTMEINSKGEVHLGDEPTVNVSVDAKPSSLEGWEKIVPALLPYQLSGSMEVHAMLRGRIGNGAVPDIQGNATLMGVSINPPKLGKPVKRLNSTVVFNGQKAETKDGSFELADSKIRFAASVEKFSPLTISYRVSTAEIRPAEFQASVAEEHNADVFRNLTSTGHFTLQGGHLSYEGNLAAAAGTLRNIAFHRLDALITVVDEVVRLRGVRVNALGGGLAGEGEYAFGESLPRFSVNATVQGIDINEFYRSLNAKTQRDFHGRLKASALLAGSGKNWNEIKPNLRGQGEAEITDGALLNFNLANAALTSTGIPALENLISPQLRKKYPETFESKDTKFRQMKAHFEIADGRINTKDLRATATDYGFQGEGWASFERKISFRTALVLSAPLSADLAQSVREARLLFNNENEFTMPLVVTGRLPKVKAKPDSRYLAKLFQRGSVRQGLEELQRRFFGNKESSAPENGDGSGQEPPKRQKNSTEERILKGLEGLFKR